MVDVGTNNQVNLEKSRLVNKSSSQNVKYQIFVSSTFKDLIEERQAISRAILELNHIPAGMELFPAFDQSQLEFIKRVIDDCDYYVIVVGGRYGSLTPEGISFTEAEYDYALEKGKPVIALLHADTGKIPSEKVDFDKQILDKLEKFRDKLKNGRLVKSWVDVNDLKSNAIISLTATFSQMPRPGWRRNDGMDGEQLLTRIELYREQMERDRSRLANLTERVAGYEDIDTAEIGIKYGTEIGSHYAAVPADQLIRELAAPLKNGFNRHVLGERLMSLIRHRFDRSVTDIKQESIDNAILFLEVFEIAEGSGEGSYIIRSDRIHLLKAAFRKSSGNKAALSKDDEF